MLMVILALFMLLTAPASAELLAVIDRSNPATAGLNADQLSLLAQTARGEAARRLVPLGFTILSEENTISILKDMGVELATCEGECEVEIARKLQADWLMSTKIVRFGETWSLQVNLFQAATGALISSERSSSKVEDDLVVGSERAASLLCERMGAQPQPMSIKDATPASTLSTVQVEQKGEPTDQRSEDGPLAGMKFVTLPAGRFQMGSPPTEMDRHRGETSHTVSLSSFSIMTTEVTQAQWQRVMGTKPARFDGHDRPVEAINWFDAQTFIDRLNQMDRTHTYRLPTEAEWEYACRAGSAGPWCVGENELELDEVAWFKPNSGGKPHPVATRKPNAWGLHDMHGNVMEWCQDNFAKHGSEEQSDPRGPDSALNRVVKGGSCRSSASDLRSASRSAYEAPSVSSDLGFRLCRSE